MEGILCPAVAATGSHWESFSTYSGWFEGARFAYSQRLKTNKNGRQVTTLEKKYKGFL